jgi:hypothetical protein
MPARSFLGRQHRLCDLADGNFRHGVDHGLFNLSGALAVLSSELRGRAAVLREACAAYGDRPISSLVEAGRGGLPQDPEATLPALYIADRDVSPTAGSGTEAGELSGDVSRTRVHLRMRCG